MDASSSTVSVHGEPWDSRSTSVGGVAVELIAVTSPSIVIRPSLSPEPLDASVDGLGAAGFGRGGGGGGEARLAVRFDELDERCERVGAAGFVATGAVFDWLAAAGVLVDELWSDDLTGIPTDCTVVILKPSGAFVVPVLVELADVVEPVDELEPVVELEEDDESAAHVGGAPMQAALSKMIQTSRGIGCLCPHAAWSS